eukprot:1389086-Rhodomonas_salina.2
MQLEGSSHKDLRAPLKGISDMIVRRYPLGTPGTTAGIKPRFSSHFVPKLLDNVMATILVLVVVLFATSGRNSYQVGNTYPRRLRRSFHFTLENFPGLLFSDTIHNNTNSDNRVATRSDSSRFLPMYHPCTSSSGSTTSTTTAVASERSPAVRHRVPGYSSPTTSVTLNSSLQFQRPTFSSTLSA